MKLNDLENSIAGKVNNKTQKNIEKKKKSIVINALQYKQNSSGIGVMIRELFSRFVTITPHPSIVILPHDGPKIKTNGKTKIVQIPWTYRQNIRRIFFQSVLLGRHYGENAVLLTTDSKTPFFLPKSCTLIPLITDLAVFRMPEVYQTSRVLWWRFQYRYLCKRAAFFLTISQFTKQEMVDVLKIRAERIYVVPCAASPCFAPVTDDTQKNAVRERYRLPQKFLLFVGNSNPRKNLKRIIQAFDILKKKEKIPHQLIIAGEQGWKFKPAEVLRTVQHPEEIRFVGFVPDEDMPTLYSMAELFLFPTLYEGFGIPVLEAQMCGVPVLTSDGSCMREVGGEGAVYVDPYNETAIAEGIRKVLQNPKFTQKMIEKGFKNAARFSWDSSAQLLNKIVEEEIKK